jgi:putative endonuclease
VEGTRQVGDEAEALAVRHLEGDGYRVLARNYSCRYGELDVVAEKGEVLCFVEVRMRTSAAWGDPSATVSWAKQRRITKAALYYLQRERLRGRQLRFDVISVLGRGGAARLEHLPAAFEAGPNDGLWCARESGF